MAKPTNPLLSLEAHGTLADALTYQRTPLANIARTKPTPTDPRTLPQVYQRWDYQDAAWYWATLTPAQKAAYKPQATRLRLPLFAYFLRYYLRNLPDLAGRWHLDEGTGTIAHDSSKNTNHGNIYGADWTRLPSGWALSFDGSDDYVNAGNDASLNPANAITLEAWIKFSADFTTQKGIVVNNAAFGLFVTSAEKIRLTFKTGGVWLAGIYSIPSYNDNKWHHLVGTYDKDAGANNLKLFIDGSLAQQGTETGSIDSSADPLIIASEHTGGRYFNGLIDEVRIYNRALQAAQILAHAQRRYPQ